VKGNKGKTLAYF